MFYNGCRIYIYAYIFYEFLFSLFQHIVTSAVMRNSTQLQLNDGNVFLNIIASPIYSILFLFICTTVYGSNLLKISQYILLLIILSQSYFYNLFDIITSVSSAFNSTSLTLTLQNGLLNIHPYIIYLIYGYIVTYIVYSIISSTIYTPTLVGSELNYVLTLLVFFSIILGAWWAAQEFNWGGFWSWDPVELISLLLWFVLVYLSHRSTTIFKHKTISWYFFIILIIYLIMRLGIINTIHSFIRGSNVTIYTYLIFFIGCITTIISLVYYISPIFKLMHLFKFKISYFFTSCIALLLVVFIILLANGLLNRQISDVLSLDTLYQVSVFTLLSWVTIHDGFFLVTGSSIFILYILCGSLNVPLIWLGMFFIKHLLKFANWVLHILILWVYIIGILFFVSMYTYYINYSLYINNFGVTDYYEYNIITNLTLGNTSVFSKFFILLSKSITTVLPGFFTYSNIFISEFLIGRVSTLTVTYVQNYIYICVYLLFFLLLSLCNRVYIISVDYY